MSDESTDTTPAATAPQYVVASVTPGIWGVEDTAATATAADGSPLRSVAPFDGYYASSQVAFALNAGKLDPTGFYWQAIA